MERMTWDQMMEDEEFRGRWVALNACEYDEWGQATAGQVVDVDDDLVELCARVGDRELTNCDILFCSDETSKRRSSAPPARDPFRRLANAS